MPIYKCNPDLKRLERLYPDAEIIPEYDIKGEGKGEALRKGSRRATRDYIIWLDGDYELPPEQIKNFLSVDADIVVGCKLLKESKINYTLIRKVICYICYWITQALFRFPIHDTQTGLKMFKREVLDKVLPLSHIKGWAFDVEILALAQQFGYTIKEIPVIVEKDIEGQSTIKLQSIYITFWDIISIFKKIKRGKCLQEFINENSI